MARRNLDVVQNNLTSDQIRELSEVSRDVFLFSTFIYVIHPVRGKVQFNLYPYQKSVLYQFLKNRFNIILKFRQAGITELISMYCLWLASYHSNVKINIISIKDITAKKVLKKIKYMYKNLPKHLQTPIINGRSGEYGSCVTGDTELILEDGTIKTFRELAPMSKGILDISSSNIKVLSHTGEYQRLLKVFNKGIMETYTIKDNRGKTLRCTPNHKLLTTEGWKPVKEILKRDLWIIQDDTSGYKPETAPVTIPPKEEIRPTKYSGYWVSNLGRVFTSKKKCGKGLCRNHVDIHQPLKQLKTRKFSHERVKLRLGDGQTLHTGVHRLVAEAFIGPIPVNYIVDHIDCNPFNNYVTNLQIVTKSENTKRAVRYSRLSIQGRNNGLHNISLIGKIKARYQELGHYYGVAKQIKRDIKDIPFDHKGVSQICRGLAYEHVYVSKIQLTNTSREMIYDCEVEFDHSYITTSNFVNHNSSMIEFSNGSFIESIPTSEEAGRSESLTLLVIDEAAIVRWASTIWAAAFPTLSTGGSAIINSTPYGLGGFYHSTWVDAVSGSSRINPIRLYWQMHPERDQAWYDEMSSVLGTKRTAQEIDGDFLSSGNSVFDLTDIKAIEDSLSEYPPIKTRFNGQYREFLEPDNNTDYFIGADCSTGRATDYSSFSCVTRDGEDAAVFKGKIPLNKYGKLLGDVGMKYNYAKLAPETNDIGMAVTMYLQDEGYPNLYYSTKLLRKKGKSRPETEEIPGWLTTTKNRSVIIEDLEKDIREDNVLIKDPFFVQEAYTFIYDGIGRPVAMGKHNQKSSVDIDLEGETYSDDSIFGKAIANRIRKGSNREVYVLPQ